MRRAGFAILSLLAAARRADAADTASPNRVIAKPACDANTTIALRYSASLERLYLESADGTTRGGCVTLKKVWEELAGRVPLYAVNASGDVVDAATGTWLLTESVYVKDGITLQVRDARRDLFSTASHCLHTHARAERSLAGNNFVEGFAPRIAASVRRIFVQYTSRRKPRTTHPGANTQALCDSGYAHRSIFSIYASFIWRC